MKLYLIVHKDSLNDINVVAKCTGRMEVIRWDAKNKDRKCPMQDIYVIPADSIANFIAKSE